MIFYSSDHHFNHARIIELSARPFSSVEEMNEALIERYNSRVGVDDLVYFLGDVFFRDEVWAKEAMRRMKGRKKLVMGNHDRLSVTRLRALGFEDVFKKHIIHRVAGRECLLSHYPYPFEPRLAGARFYLHGHSHTRTKRVGLGIHVGVDAWDYYPVSEDEIGALMNEGEIEDLGRLNPTMGG